MYQRAASVLIPAATAVAAVGLLVHWLVGRPVMNELTERVPLAPTTAQTVAAIDLRGDPIPGAGKPSALPGAWPRFRGPNGDGISPETTPLRKTFDAGGVPVLWKLDVGDGYAGAAIRDGRVYFLDYDDKERADVFRCLSLDDGREIWRRSYRIHLSWDHGYSRTVPALHDRYAVVMGPKCHVSCVEADTGRFVWGLDLVKDFGATVPPWYAGQCVLIDRGRAILGVGGDALLMAVDLPTGNIVWRSPNPRRWKMTHTSVVPMKLAGRDTYIYCASGGVAGVSADDGSILWELPDWRVNIAAIASPLVIDDSRVFLSGGYGVGSMMIRITPGENGFHVTQLFRLKPEVFGAEQHTPILYQGHIFGVIPPPIGQFVCLDLEGRQVWASGGKRVFGLGGYILADGAFWVLNDTGRLTVIEATTAGYRELATVQVMDRAHDSWAPPAIASGLMIVRDTRRMFCLDLRRK